MLERDQQSFIFLRPAGGDADIIGQPEGGAVSPLHPLPQQGLLIAKRLYDELGGHDEHSAQPERDLYRRLGRKRIVLLRSSASKLAD